MAVDRRIPVVHRVFQRLTQHLGLLRRRRQDKTSHRGRLAIVASPAYMSPAWRALPAPPGYPPLAAPPIWAGTQLLELTNSGQLLAFHR